MTVELCLKPAVVLSGQALLMIFWHSDLRVFYVRQTGEEFFCVVDLELFCNAFSKL